MQMPSARRAFATIAISGLIVCTPLLARVAQAAELTPVAPLRKIDTTGFRTSLYRQGAIYLAGYPSAEDIAWAKTHDVTRVINLLPDQEIVSKHVPHSRASAEAVGLDWVAVPIGDRHEASPETLRQVRVAVEGATGNVLIHCWSSGRSLDVWQALVATDPAGSPGLASKRLREAAGPSDIERMVGRDLDLQWSTHR